MPETMIDEFSNRQAMHLTVIELLENPEYTSVWQDQVPVKFTQKAGIFRTKTAALTILIGKQEAELKGRAEQKNREEEELETIAHEIGSVFADYLDDYGLESEAAEIDLSLTKWRRLKDTALLAKARLLISRLSAALLVETEILAEYGLTSVELAALVKETDDYEGVIESPSGGIATRKALTAALRPSFREVSALLTSMDRLVLRFRSTPQGKAFAANWKTARTVRDLGSNNPGESEPPAP